MRGQRVDTEAGRSDVVSLALAPSQIEAITAACRRHPVAHMHAFGSVVRSDYRPGESDIDLLVEFHPCESGLL